MASGCISMPVLYLVFFLVMFWDRLHIQDVASQIHIDLFIYLFLNKGVFRFCWCKYIKYFTFWVNICVLSLLELSEVLGHRLSQFSYVLNKKAFPLTYVYTFARYMCLILVAFPIQYFKYIFLLLLSHLYSIDALFLREYGWDWNKFVEKLLHFSISLNILIFSFCLVT